MTPNDMQRDPLVITSVNPWDLTADEIKRLIAVLQYGDSALEFMGLDDVKGQPSVCE